MTDRPPTADQQRVIDDLHRVALAVMQASASLSSATAERDRLIQRGLALGLKVTTLSTAGSLSRQAIHRRFVSTDADCDADPNQSSVLDFPEPISELEGDGDPA